MREIEERSLASALPRSVKATALAVFGMMAVAFSAPSLAGNTADNVRRTPGEDNTTAGQRETAAAENARLAATRDAISRAIESYGKDVQDAYHRELMRNPKIAGEITIAFEVLPGGEVADVKVANSSLNWPPLEEEVLTRIKGWRFPAFQGPPIPATVPYKFGPR